MMKARKPADLTLTPNLLSAKGAAAVPSDSLPQRVPPAPASASPAPRADMVPLNFRVPADFKRRFRLYAAQNGIKLTDVLSRAFDLLESTK